MGLRVFAPWRWLKSHLKDAKTQRTIRVSTRDQRINLPYLFELQVDASRAKFKALSMLA